MKEVSRKDSQLEKVKKERQRKIELFNQVFATEEGVLVLKEIAQMCGQNKVSIVADPASGEINPLSTIYNEARRNLYLSIRSYIRPSTLKKVEF